MLEFEGPIQMNLDLTVDGDVDVVDYNFKQPQCCLLSAVRLALVIAPLCVHLD